MTSETRRNDAAQRVHLTTIGARVVEHHHRTVLVTAISTSAARFHTGAAGRGRPPKSWTWIAPPPIYPTHCGQLILTKNRKSDATKCQILRLKCKIFACLIKLLPCIIFEEYIYILANWKWPAQGTSTVSIVSAHFRSLLAVDQTFFGDESLVKKRNL